MTLTEGIYEIPASCTALYKDRKIIVKKKKNLDKENVIRCRHCEHCKYGKMSMRNQFWDSDYCEMKPKTIYGENKYFYSTLPSRRAEDCKNFKLKENI